MWNAVGTTSRPLRRSTRNSRLMSAPTARSARSRWPGAAGSAYTATGTLRSSHCGTCETLPLRECEVWYVSWAGRASGFGWPTERASAARAACVSSGSR